MSDDVFNTRALDRITKAIKSNKLQAKVGIMGDKDSRTGGANGNAQIGAKHEFGMEGLPQRSFLRIPITENMQTFLEASKAFTPDSLKEVIRSASMELWVKRVGIVAEQIVREAFNTEGFGKWKKTVKTVPPSLTTQTLVETTQLRDSITSVVK